MDNSWMKENPEEYNTTSSEITVIILPLRRIWAVVNYEMSCISNSGTYKVHILDPKIMDFNKAYD